MKTANSKSLPDFFEFGPYRFDTRDNLLFKNGEEVHLTPKVGEILLALLKKHGHVVEKEELMQEVWPSTAVEENNLTRNISTLRKLLNPESEEDHYIETLPRRGYRFVAEVREINEAPPVVEILSPTSHVFAPDPAPVHRFATEWQDSFTDVSPSDSVAAAMEKKEPGTQRQENTKISTAGVSQFAKSRFRLNTLLLLIIAALLFWQLSVFYQVSRPSPREAATEAIPQLQLNRLPTKGIPQVAELSPDGKTIAYAASDESGQQSLYLSDVKATTEKQLVPPSESRYQGLSFAPGGNHLYFTLHEEKQKSVLYRLSVFGDAPPQKLTALGSAGPVGFSPDGVRMAFIRENAKEGTSALFIANPDGSAERKLLERKRPDFFPMTGSPSWSPDGQTLICVIGSIANGIRHQLASISLRSGQPEQEAALTIHPTQWPWIYETTWLPGGRELLLLADEQPGGWRDQLWLMTWPEGKLRRLTNDLNDYSGISPAADSASLVTIQSNHLSDIWIVPHQTGGRSQRITPFNDRREGLRGLDWTPDGNLVFTSLEAGRDHIWSLKTDGTQRQDLTLHGSGDSNNHSPALSPDGRTVVFVSDRQGQTRIWRMNLDGSNPLPLTEGHDDLDPQVSADGLWVIYSSAKSGNRNLWKVPLAGGPETRAIDVPVESATVSPISNLIAYTWRETGASPQNKLAVIDLENRQPPRWFALPEPSARIRWMPDGTALSYILTRNGIANLWSQPLTGGQPAQITDLSFENVASFAWSRDGRRLAIARVQEIKSIVFITSLK